MAKNKREKALICPLNVLNSGNDISTIVTKKWKVLQSFSTILQGSKIGKNWLFQRGTCSRYEMKSDFQVSDTGFKKVSNGK